ILLATVWIALILYVIFVKLFPIVELDVTKKYGDYRSDISDLSKVIQSETPSAYSSGDSDNTEGAS
ncbi:MAG: hypothetical protein ACXAEX_04845, partial [Promethearchaeota archaeon]